MRHWTVLLVALALMTGSTWAADPCCRLFVDRVGATQGNTVCASSDGGHVIGSYRQNTTTGEDLFVVAFPCQTSAWTREIYGSGDEVANCIVRTRDGGYVLSGYTTSYGQGRKDALATKFDASGNHLWTRVWGGPADDEARGIIEGADGNLYVAGYTRSFNALQRHDLFLARVPANGAGLVDYTVVNDPGLPWNHCTGQFPIEVANGFVVVGMLTNQLGTAQDILLVRFQTLHQVSYARRYGLAAGLAHAASAIRTSDGSVAITGWLQRTVPVATALFVFKVKPDLSFVWGCEMGQQQPIVTRGHDLVELSGAELVVVGSYGVQDQEDVLATKWSPSGGYLGGGSFAVQTRSAAYSVANVRHDHVVLTGSTWSSGGVQTLLRAKTNSCGETCLPDLGAPPRSAWNAPTVSIGLQATRQTSSVSWSPPIRSPALAVTPICGWRLGDMNCDGRLDFDDINPFVLYVSNCPAWKLKYPNCEPLRGDMNGDCQYCGPLSIGDINAFVSCLASGAE